MNRFVFREATAADDASLRAIMREVELQSHISVSFRREPSYFAGCKVQGSNTRVMICCDGASDEAIGFGTRLTRNVYLNGGVRKIGFLSDLRIKQQYRNSFVLHRLYRELWRAHQDDPVPFYLTMILDGNEQARSALLGARAGLPCYTSLGKINTPLILFGRKQAQQGLGRLSVTTGKKNQLPHIYDFLNHTLRSKQFSSVYKAEELEKGRGAPKAEDFYVASLGGELVGVVLAWDQREIRQTCVEAYSPILGVTRPFYNLAAQMLGSRKLPAPGEKLSYFSLSHIAIAENNPQIFDALLSYLYEDRRSGPWSYCVAGLHEGDPLNSVLEKYRKIRAGGELFLVHYDPLPQLDQRIPYLDIATV